MRVCVVPHRYPPDGGGVASASQRYVQGLTLAGHQVAVIRLDPTLAPGKTEQRERAFVTETAIGTHRRADDTHSAWFDAVVSAHHQAPFDVVVGRYLDAASYVAVYAARFLSLPSVVSARGNDVDRGAFDGATLSQLLWTVSHASAVTAVSQELRRKLRALIPTVEPIVVHNGVDTDLFSPGPRAAARPQVLFVGEARKKKGLPVLLEAHARVAASRDRDVELLLIGGVRTEDAEILQVFTHKNPQVSVRVLQAVPQAELVHHYRSAALLVMPSLHDGLPNALLEAMACGCPVVATSVGGIPDVVSHEVEGLLVPAGDVTALAQAIERTLQAPSKSAERAARARERVLRDFSAEQERLTDLRLLERLVSVGEARPQ